MITIRKQFKLIPSRNLYMAILLTSTVKDLGFFDSYVEPYRPPYGYGYGYGYGYSNDNNGIGIDNLL